jgi:hypothetical protein
VNNFSRFFSVFCNSRLCLKSSFLALKSIQPPLFSALFNSASGSIFSYVSLCCIPLLHTFSFFLPASSGLYTQSSCLLCKGLYLIVHIYRFNTLSFFRMLLKPSHKNSWNPKRLTRPQPFFKLRPKRQRHSSF